MTRNRRVSGRPVRGHLRRTALGVVMLASAASGVPAWASEGGGNGLIDLNWTLFVQVVNFLILLAVLYALAFKPLGEALRARTATIQQQLAEARAAREEAQRQLTEFESRLRAAQAEAQAVRERALREAAETRDRLAAEARQEAVRLVEAARAEVAQEVRRAKAELRAEVGALAVAVAERLIKKSLADEDHRRIVQDALARMDVR
jgi:F-type H+-transporting ATPase subunit b